MSDWNNLGAIAATTGAPVADVLAGCARNFPANRMLSIRRIDANADDAGVGGWVRFTLTLANTVTGAVLLTWETLLLVPATGAVVTSVGDRMIFTNTGTQSATLAVVVMGQNGGERAAIDVSGQMSD